MLRPLLEVPTPPLSRDAFPAGLTWPLPRAPSASTWVMCCTRPTCVSPRQVALEVCEHACCAWRRVGGGVAGWLDWAASCGQLERCLLKQTELPCLPFTCPCLDSVAAFCSRQGRLLLWAWLQERRAPGTAATYSGCLTVPRMVSLSPDGCRLLQQPAPEVARLRRCYRSHPGNGAQVTEGSDGSPTQPPAAAGLAAG